MPGQYLYDLQGAKAAETLLGDLCRALDSEHEGCLKVLRHGFQKLRKNLQGSILRSCQRHES
jgi:hypothetical protein